MNNINAYVCFKTQHMRKLIVIVILMLSTITHAHKDIWREFKYGNVQAGIVTGFEDYHEIIKVKIINELAFKLSEKLNYDKPILLIFRHDYIDTISKCDYYISMTSWKFELNRRTKKGLQIEFFGNDFNVSECLKTVEYAIQNSKSIKSSQRKITHIDQWREEDVISIDTTLIKDALRKDMSPAIKDICQMKIYPDQQSNYSQGFTYYWQNSKFYFERIDKDERKTVLTLDSVRYYKYFWGNVMVFDTQNTFYYLDRRSGSASSRQFIEVDYNRHRPYKIEILGDSKYAILNQYPPIGNDRIIYYSFNDNLLLQDLNQFIQEKK